MDEGRANVSAAPGGMSKEHGAAAILEGTLEAPALTWRPVPSLKELLVFHSYKRKRDPVFAHWSAAAGGIFLGALLGAARGLAFAATCPPGARVAGFRSVTPAASFLYGTFFALGAQVDCFESSWEQANGKRRTRRDLTHGSVDLG